MTDQSTSQPQQPAQQAVAVIAAPASTRQISVFDDLASFEAAQRVATALASSSMVPESYRGKDGMGNCLIAIDFAKRTNSSPLAVMQNLNIIEGRPSWSAPFIIAALNSCGMFSPLRFKIEAKGKKKVTFDVWQGPKGQREKVSKTEEIEDTECTAIARDLSSGEDLIGPTASISMAVAEGWYGRNGSKWRTMPDVMLRYRAAAFFGRLYAPHVLMGMHTQDEAEDIASAAVDITPPAATGPAPAMVQPTQAASDAVEKQQQTATKTSGKAAKAEEKKAGQVIDGEARTVPTEEKPVPEMAKPAQQAGAPAKKDGKELF